MKDVSISELKQMNIIELEHLASDIREEIIHTTSLNGGHLASNLGVVELTIALHKVFDSPKDKIIFDVSHQTYAHKILTGRLKKFNTLRTFDGISGFAKYDESCHDAFEGGHSSTSLSAGLGFLEAKKTKESEIGEVVCLIGDASISNGLCFEALNYLSGHPEEKMIIIINDNNMSVSKNVGGLAKRYNSIRTKKGIKFLKKFVPLRLKHAMQYYAYKVDLFTSLGFHYFENIDGHNIPELIKYLNYAKNSNKSIVLHVKTIKGKGYEFAEKDTIGKWHGTGPFDIQTGMPKSIKRGPSFGEVISHELCTVAKNNPFIRVITPAMILGSGLTSFANQYPNYTIDVGIAEENALVMASAMAKSGMIPIVFIYSSFLQRGYDELIHDIARTNMHVVLCVDRAGIVPQDGDTHQGIYDIAFLHSIPNIKIWNPITQADAKKMIRDACLKEDGPIVIRYPKGSSVEGLSYFNEMNYNVIKEGKVMIISYGPNILAIYQRIVEEKLNVGLIAIKDVSKVDTSLITYLNKQCSGCYVYEEVIKNSNYAMLLREARDEANATFKINSTCLENTYLRVGSCDEIKKYYHITIDDFLVKVKEGLKNAN